MFLLEKKKHTLQADHVHLQAFIFMDCAAEMRDVNEETQIWEADLMRSHLKPFTWAEDRGAEPKQLRQEILENTTWL